MDFLGEAEGSPSVQSTWQTFLVSGSTIRRIALDHGWAVLRSASDGGIALTGEGIALGRIGKSANGPCVNRFILLRKAPNAYVSCCLGGQKWVLGGMKEACWLAAPRNGSEPVSLARRLRCLLGEPREAGRDQTRYRPATGASQSKTYVDELVELLNQAHIEYDPKYLL